VSSRRKKEKGKSLRAAPSGRSWLELETGGRFLSVIKKGKQGDSLQIRGKKKERPLNTASCKRRAPSPAV